MSSFNKVVLFTSMREISLISVWELNIRIHGCGCIIIGKFGCRVSTDYRLITVRELGWKVLIVTTIGSAKDSVMI